METKLLPVKVSELIEYVLYLTLAIIAPIAVPPGLVIYSYEAVKRVRRCVSCELCKPWRSYGRDCNISVVNSLYVPLYS